MDGLNNLPAGWSVKNSSGSYNGPAVLDEEDVEMQEEYEAQGIDVRPDSPGWEDVNVEDDRETLSFQCFLCERTFEAMTTMVEHAKQEHHFDFVQVVQTHKLDFFATMKLVNYLRSSAKAGNGSPDVSAASQWSDDKYMQPVLEDDAALFSLEDVIAFEQEEEPAPADADPNSSKPKGAGHIELVSRAIHMP